MLFIKIYSKFAKKFPQLQLKLRTLRVTKHVLSNSSSVNKKEILFRKKTYLSATEAENSQSDEACIGNVSNSVNKKGIVSRSVMATKNKFTEYFKKQART